MRHVHLDPIGAVLELLPRCLARFRWTIHNLRAFWHDQLRSVIFQVVTARRGNGACGPEDARPRNRAFFDRLLDLDVTVPCAFRFQIANRSEPLF